MTHPRMRARTVAVLLTAAIVAHGAAASAQCVDRSDVGTLKRGLSQAVRCNDRTLRRGPDIACPQTPPPACAGTAKVDVVALGYGPSINPAAAAVDSGALNDQLRCQKQIGKAVRHYLVTKMRALITGRPADPAAVEEKASRHLDRLADRCAVNVAQDGAITLPNVGPQCASAVPAPGGPVDTEALRACLLTLLQVWADRWGPDPQPLRPNIIFILTDDQRWDSTGATHSLTAQPVMAGTRRELADNGIEFPNAFITTPLCCPSRSSILAGSYAHRTGVYRNNGVNGGADDFEDASTIATWLQGAGYRTSLIGKYLNGYGNLWNNGMYVPPNWTEWRALQPVAFFNYSLIEPDGLGGYAETPYGSDEADYSTDVLREKAKAFIGDSVALGEPFFLYLAFKAPHLPQIPAPRHEGMFEGITDWRPPSYNEPDVSDKPSWVQNTAPMTQQEQDNLDQVRIDQLEMLQAVDEAVGGSTTYGIVGIMEHLRNLGVADETLVVFFADNGWHWGEHRFRAKNKPYEESIRSPMLVYYPKLVPMPRVEQRFALNIDFAATFADLAGITPPVAHDGESIVRVLDGTAPTWRSDFLTEGWPGNHPWATVREARWKYTEIPTDPGNPATSFERELYDLETDPYELDNLAADPQHAGRIAAMAVRLRELRPNWPIDSDAGGPDLPEDPGDD